MTPGERHDYRSSSVGRAGWVALAVAALVIVVYGGYGEHWSWTGINGTTATLWDWLHHTLRLNVPQPEITIGVPGFQNVDDVGLTKMLALPFDPDVSLAGEGPARSAPLDPSAPLTRLLP